MAEAQGNGESSGSRLKLMPLTFTNWVEWKKVTTIILSKNRLLGVVDGTERSLMLSGEALEKWVSKDYAAQDLLLSGLNDAEREQYLGAESSHAI